MVNILKHVISLSAHLLFFIADIIIRGLLFIIGIVLSPLLYLSRFKSDEIWNRFQNKPYNIWVLGSVFGNNEDGVYFDPRVLEAKPHLLNIKYRGTFRDFFTWNILRNPFHNYELAAGTKVTNIKDFTKHEKIFIKGYCQLYTAELNNGFYRYFVKIEYIIFSKKLTAYWGARINDLRTPEQLNINDIYYKFYNDFIEKEKPRYIQHRGYPTIRNGAAFRFKSI